MIEFIKKGDILQSDAEALVNTVNCVGVMGRGIALQFKNKFPENYVAYKKVCDAGLLRPGNVLVHDMGELYNPRFIINFATKDHWRTKSRLSDIEAGLVALVEEIKRRKIKSIAVPPLGCGLGGLSWNDVQPLMTKAFEALEDVNIDIFEPSPSKPGAHSVELKKVPNMTVGRAAMIGLIRRYLSAVMDPYVSLLEIHKLMYFIVTFGEDIPKLSFSKGPYGPYAEKLRHVLIETEGSFTKGFGDGDDDPEKPLELVKDAVDKADAFLANHPETKERFNKVAKLISGFETPFGMELLATVLWVHVQERASNFKQAVQKVYAWNTRKLKFSESQIELAWNVLKNNGLISAP